MQYSTGCDTEIARSLLIGPATHVSRSVYTQRSEEDVHLSATENQPLLWWWYTRLLLDLLLDACDLKRRAREVSGERAAERRRLRTNLVIEVDIKLDLRDLMSRKPSALRALFEDVRPRGDRHSYLLARECLQKHLLALRACI